MLSLMIVGLVATGIGAFPMRLTPPELLVLLIAMLFVVNQTLDIWHHDRRQLIWAGLGALLWSAIAWWFMIALDTVWESLLFFGLSALSLCVAFYPAYRVKAASIFLEISLCFSLCHMIMPGRLIWYGYVSSYGVIYPTAAVTRDTAVIIINMLTLGFIIAAYVVALRLKVLPSHGQHLASLSK